MGEQVYRVEDLRLQMLAVLRRNQPMKAGAICMAMRVPLWAVFAAIESAVAAKLVTYVPGAGYELVDDVEGVAV